MPSTDNQSELDEKLLDELRVEMMFTDGYFMPRFGGGYEAAKKGTEEQIKLLLPVIKRYAKRYYKLKSKAHDTKLYEQVMDAIGEDKSVKQLLPNVEFKPDEYCAGIVAAKDASNRNLKELRTAINKIFNKENNNG